jgi:amidophosphoribosyltransferase
MGAREVREVEPGEIILINEDGLQSMHRIEPERLAHCIFEYIYFSRPDSRIFGANVDKIRRRLGRTLAREAPAPTADIVISVPDSSNTAALGYAQESGIQHEIGLIRNHYVGRSFIRPEQDMRDLTVKLKYNTVRGVLEGKEVVIVDDSIVRGTTMRNLVRLLRGADVSKVHVRVSSPPIRHSCYFGLDFPTREELIAGSSSTGEIANFLGVDSLAYLSLEGLLGSMDQAPEHFCNACFSGDYPVKIKELPSKHMFDGVLGMPSIELTAPQL